MPLSLHQRSQIQNQTLFQERLWVTLSRQCKTVADEADPILPSDPTPDDTAAYNAALAQERDRKALAKAVTFNLDLYLPKFLKNIAANLPEPEAIGMTIDQVDLGDYPPDPVLIAVVASFWNYAVSASKGNI